MRVEALAVSVETNFSCKSDDLILPGSVLCGWFRHKLAKQESMGFNTLENAPEIPLCLQHWMHDLPDNVDLVSSHPASARLGKVGKVVSDANLKG